MSPEAPTKSALVAVAAALLVMPAATAPGQDFEQHTIYTALKDSAEHLLEPVIKISDTGTMFVQGHSLYEGVRSPLYESDDGGSTWRFVAHPASFSGQEGQTIVDSSAHVWEIDGDVFATMAIYKWCNDGELPCGGSPDVWNHPPGPCSAGAVDRPWGAWGGSRILLVNYQGTLPPQLGGGGYGRIGLMRDDQLGPPAWNTCGIGPGASTGVPAMRSDGGFAFPQRQPLTVERLSVGLGTDPVFVTTKKAFDTNIGNLSCQENWGWTGFDSTDRLFVAASSTESSFSVATLLNFSEDFAATTYDVGGHLQSLWLATSKARPGAVVFFAVGADCSSGLDYYAIHVRLVNGALSFEDLLSIGHVTMLCRDHNGGAVGTNGRAYLVVHDTGGTCDTTETTPLKVFVQVSGPVL